MPSRFKITYESQIASAKIGSPIAVLAMPRATREPAR
jgi:hypothetical protein